MSPPKVGGKRELGKKEGPKGSREWGDRKPEPKDPNAPEKAPTNDYSAGPLYSFKTGSDHAYAFDTRTSEQDKTFVQGLRVKTSDVEILSANVKLAEGKGKLVLAKGSVEASVVHAEADLVEVVSAWLFGKPKPTREVPAPPSVSMAPMAVRLGDLTTHLSPLLPGPASPNVYIAGMPAWRCGIDLALCPFPGAAPHGIGPTLPGERTVLVNGMPAARMGDFVAEPSGGPNVIVTGCPTVMIGSPAPPPPEPPPAPKPEKPWVVFGATATGDIVKGSAKADASVDWDAKKAKGKAEASAGAEVALFKGELPLRVKIRIPETDLYLGLGLTVEASALSLGAEGGIGGKLNEDGEVFAGSMGAKVDAGLGGLGAKFSVDLGE